MQLFISAKKELTQINLKLNFELLTIVILAQRTLKKFGIHPNLFDLICAFWIRDLLWKQIEIYLFGCFPSLLNNSSIKVC